MKRCYYCKEEKDLNEFGIRRRNPDGHSEICKKCACLKQKAYYRSEKGNAKYKEYEHGPKRKASRQKPSNKLRKLEYERRPDRKLKKLEYHRRDYVVAKRRERNRIWRKLNQAKKNAEWAEYRARKLNATPKWLTKEEKECIVSIYKHSKYLKTKLGINTHVDHIIPLRGNTVCGLHVPWNLQIISAEDNLKKGNRI